jgi:hypothetical protein
MRDGVTPFILAFKSQFEFDLSGKDPIAPTAIRFDNPAGNDAKK